MRRSHDPDRSNHTIQRICRNMRSLGMGGGLVEGEMKIFDFFREKVKEMQRTATVGKAIMRITTNNGDIYNKEIKGYYDKFMGDVYTLGVRGVYDNYRRSTNNFIAITPELSIPVCNITKMELVDVDEFYSVEVK